MYRVSADDEAEEPLYTMLYRGFHVIFNEPLLADEEVQFKKYLDYVRQSRREKVNEFYANLPEENK